MTNDQKIWQTTPKETHLNDLEKKNATGNRDTILCSAAAESAMNMENACSHLSKGLNDLKQYGTHEKNHFLG